MTEISIRLEKRSEPYKVGATVYGPLAVHKALASTMAGEIYLRDTYQLTHIATGMRVGPNNLKINVARRVAKALKDRPEWADVPNDYMPIAGVAQPEALKLLYPIVKAAFDEALA